MPEEYPQVIVLGEDRRHYDFVRHFLMKRGVPDRKFFPKICPKGRGSGEQYVREHYPVEVKALRSKSYLRIVLVVVTDADVRTVDQRLDQLATALREAELAEPGIAEPIVILVPKRNVETWVYYLRDNEVNEQDDYKTAVGRGAVRTEAREFAQRCPHDIPDDMPASLRRACEELVRVMG